MIQITHEQIMYLLIALFLVMVVIIIGTAEKQLRFNKENHRMRMWLLDLRKFLSKKDYEALLKSYKEDY